MARLRTIARLGIACYTEACLKGKRNAGKLQTASSNSACRIAQQLSSLM
jgi:hypothetical protein